MIGRDKVINILVKNKVELLQNLFEEDGNLLLNSFIL